MIWWTAAAAFVVALAWVAVWFPGMPWWVAAIVTAVLVLALVAAFVVRQIRAARKASALERELLRQAEQQADHLRPERRVEVLELKARMKKAIDELKRSKLGGKGGSGALYALPWYVIVGPPAAGKTTALSQSELAFVSPGGGSPRLQGTAGTKNCDWWFSKEAILLDTAGRFVTQEDDEEEWLAFLDTLKLHRGKRPLDGVLVAVSVSDIAGGEHGGVEELARKVRGKVDELLARLDMVVPMYVVFTKADLIAGFVEFWSDLNKQQRRQPWGATFRFDDPRLSDPSAAFEDEFRVLLGALHARLLQRLPDERVAGARTRVLQFPAELDSLGPLLARFVGELCQPNPYKDSALFRGFYFTSGTQVGSPFERVLGDMLAGFGLADRFAGAAGGVAQSYFVTDLFKTIVFPDRDAAIRSGRFAASRARGQIVAAGAGLLSMLGVAGCSLVSYVENQDLVHRTSRQIDEVLKAPVESASEQSGQRLDALLDRVRDLEAAEERFSIHGLVGPYTASTLRPAVHRLYTNRVRAIVEGPVRAQVLGDVRGVQNLVRVDDPENFWAAYDALKLYVLMTEPVHLTEGEKPEDLAAWASRRLADEWARLSGVSGETERARLEAHAKYYVAAVAKDASWAWPKGDDAAAAARRRLSEQPLEALQYSWLLRSAKDARPVRPDQIFLGVAASYVSSRAPTGVPGVYTRDGWDKVKPGLEATTSAFVLEPWVLGAHAAGARLASAERLRDLYFDEYVRAWRDFIGNLVVATPASVEDAISELRALNGLENGPYATLFRTLALNARLDMTPASLKGKLVEGAKDLVAAASAKVTKGDAGPPASRTVSGVEERLGPLVRFGVGESTRGSAPAAPAPLVQCLEELRTLEVKLGMLRESKAEPTQALSEELARTSSTVERLLTGLDGATRLLVEPLLMNPIRGSRAGVATTATSALGDKWKSDVWAIYEGKIASRYPFTAGPDVALADFVEFFRPTTGVLWSFFEKNLAERIERSGSVFTPRPSVEPAGVTGELLRCLGHAQLITDAVFGSGAEPAVPFSVRLDTGGVDVGKVTLTIDGQPLLRGKGPEQWLPATWPGKGPARGASVKVEARNFTDEVPRTGDFGFFRLLASGGLKAVKQEAPTYVATFALSREGAPPLTLSVRPSKAVHPFADGFFSRLRCPQAITVGGGP